MNEKKLNELIKIIKKTEDEDLIKPTCLKTSDLKYKEKLDYWRKRLK